MAVNPAIATIWSGKLLENLDKAHVFMQLTNQDYQGEIGGKGDVLKIFAVGRPTVNTYNVGSNVTYQRLRPTPMVLVIDQDDYWAIQEDDLEKMLESVSTMERLIKEGAYQFADTSDIFLAKLMIANCPAANLLPAATIGNGPTDKKAADLIIDMWEQAMTNNIGEGAEMGVVVPFWFDGMLEKDQRFTGFGTPQSRATLRGEPIGMVKNVAVYHSNNVIDNGTGTAAVSGGTYRITCAAKMSTTYGYHRNGTQIQTFDSSQNINGFDDLARSRFVFGGTVTRPEGIVCCDVQPGS